MSSFGASSLPAGVSAPYDWALDQLRVPEAHAICRGSPEVVAAVIDLGYCFHPDHAGHLWENPAPTRGDCHGWDFADDDASLEYPGERLSPYYRDHHAFVVGEVAAVAPECPIMVLRVGYGPGQADSWPRAVEYAVEHGAKVLVIPHGYIQGHASSGTPFFYQGTDFGYPFDLPELKQAYDRACRAGCLVVSGVSDNRGRRAAFAPSAFASVLAVGSTNRRGEPANTAPSSDYVEVAAPAGQRGTGDPAEAIWGTGGNGGYVPFEGGCMAAGFAGGVAALVMARYPELNLQQVRQILRNTARGKGWDPRLGHGILDAAAALDLAPRQMIKSVQVRPETASCERLDGGWVVRLELENPGVFDVEQAVAVVYDGDPTCPADPRASLEAPCELLVRQLGHTQTRVPGLEIKPVQVELRVESLPPALWVQVFAGDVDAAPGCCTARWAL